MIWWIVLAAWLASGIFVARNSYQRMRLYDEPLSCDYTYGGHKHTYRCHQQPGSLTSSNNEAAFVAIMTGLSGILGLLALGLIAIVKGSAKPLPAELEAKLKRLEAEDAKWRREHGD